MKSYSEQTNVWSNSTTMIFYGVLALTIFGFISAPIEFVTGILDTVFNIANTANEYSYGTLSQYYTDCPFFKTYNTLKIAMPIAQLLTVGGWIMYVIGLAQFKHAQTTDRGLWLTGSLNTACWLGLISMGCYFLSGFLGMLGLLFKFTGWILSIISLFKFRSAFNRLTVEESWNGHAQRGAANLRASYTFAIILWFFPIICILACIFVFLGALGNSGSVMREIANYGPSVMLNYAGGAMAIIIILILTSFTLWILQIVKLFSGWNLISNGSLVHDENDSHNTEGFTSGSDDNEIDYSTARFDDDDNAPKRPSAGLVAGAIAGAVAIVALIIWFCMKNDTPKPENDNIDALEAIEAINSIKELSKNESSYSSDNSTDNNVDTDAPSEEEGGNEYTYRYHGYIDGKYEIEMILSTDGGAYYSGEYWYTKNKTPIQLSGEEESDGDSYVIRLNEYVDGNITGTFLGKETNSGFSGTWTNADGSKSMPFSLKTK